MRPTPRPRPLHIGLETETKPQDLTTLEKHFRWVRNVNLVRSNTTVCNYLCATYRQPSIGTHSQYLRTSPSTSTETLSSRSLGSDTAYKAATIPPR